MDLRTTGERWRLSSNRRTSRLPGIYVSTSRLGGGPRYSDLRGGLRRRGGGDLEILIVRLSLS